MGEAFEVEEITTKRSMKDFIRFPHELYCNDQYYVPLPDLFIKDMLDPAANPFFKNGEVACFLARDTGGKVIGRIAAIHNKAHLSVYQDNTGFFGFFDCIDDEHVAGILFQKAEAWLGKKGLTKMLGPENLTTNDPTGILTEGFEDSPVFFMPYNFPYYEKLLRANGFAEAMSLYSYEASLETLPSMIYQKALTIENRLQQQNISFRYFAGNNFLQEMKRLNKVYNQSNKDNWGFLPLDEESFLHMAKGLKQVVDKESVLFAEKDGVLVGFAVSVPDYNQVFKKMPGGKLLPWGWWHLLTGRKHIDRIRIIILGVLPQWRGLGIDWCLYAKIAAYAKEKQLKTGEACYVMQNNTAMNKMMEALGAKIVKKYKLFERAIVSP